MAPATANKHLAALRGVLRQAWRMGLMSAEDYQRAIDLPPVHGEAPRPARALGDEELRALVGSCERDSSPAGLRDAALFAVLFGAGLRRSEVVAIELSNYDRASGTLRVERAEGRPARRFTANPEARTALDAWIERRGTQAGPLFNPINKGGRIEYRRLSEQAIYVACRKRASEAGLEPVSPEDLRRSLLEQQSRRMRRVRPASLASAPQIQVA
jgi:integrase